MYVYKTKSPAEVKKAGYVAASKGVPSRLNPYQGINFLVWLDGYAEYLLKNG